MTAETDRDSVREAIRLALLHNDSGITNLASCDTGDQWEYRAEMQSGRIVDFAVTPIDGEMLDYARILHDTPSTLSTAVTLFDAMKNPYDAIAYDPIADEYTADILGQSGEMIGLMMIPSAASQVDDIVIDSDW